MSVQRKHMTCPIFLEGGASTGALMRTHDWSTSPLGPPEAWPQSLRTAVTLMLGTGHPICLSWGPDLAFLYNDAYAPILGARHPGALGRPIAEVWADVWPDIEPLVERALAGEAIWHEDMHLVVTRNGYREDTWCTFSYSPLRDDDGRVAGFIDVCNDTTGKVLAERRLQVERGRLARMFEQAPGFMAMLEGPEHRMVLTNPAYLRLVGNRDVLGKTVAEALPDAAAQGYLDLLDRVYRSGEAYSSKGAKYAVQATIGGPIDERFVDFVYQPLTGTDGKVTGIFVEASM